MSTLIINKNKYLSKKKDLLMNIARDTVASFSLEGIHISIEEAYLLVLKSASAVKK